MQCAQTPLRTISLATICLLFVYSAHAQSFYNQWQGARSAGLGHANVAMVDAFSQINNQAAAAFVDDFTIGAYGNQSFMVEGINNLSLSSTIPSKVGNFGVSIGYFGYSEYNEQKIGIGYSRQLSPDFSIGVQFDYLSTHVSEFGNATAFTAELGLMYQVTDQLTAGAHVFNPVLAGFSESEDPLPTLMKLGVHYEASDKVAFVAEAEKDLHHPVNFKGGVEYRPVQEVSLRVGTSSNPVLMTFGAGFKWNNLLFDVATSYHSQLGLTPHGGVIYRFQKKDE